LKAASCVSKRWRETVLPNLFRHARFVVKEPKPKSPTPHLQTEIQPFLKFVTKNQMLETIQTFVLAINDRSTTGDHVVPEHKFDLFAQFWFKLFEHINPVELLIIAHPQVLGRLTSCQVEAADNWNFDCPCHYLRLRRPANVECRSREDIIKWCESARVTIHQDGTWHENGERPEVPPVPGNGRHPHDMPLVPHGVVHPQKSTLFQHRPWTSILLNEGSFIKAYSTYEFWLRQAPSGSFLPLGSRIC
jgi:hypothetical protein